MRKIYGQNILPAKIFRSTVCAFDYVAGCNTVLCIYTHALCYIVMSARILVLSKQFIYDVYIAYLRVIVPIYTYMYTCHE